MSFCERAQCLHNLDLNKEQKCLHSTEQVIKAAEDCARQYMNFMNVIFAAQKQVLFMFVCLIFTLDNCDHNSLAFRYRTL